MYHDFSQAMWQYVPDEEIDGTQMCIGALRFLNFYRPARLEKMALPYGWFQPRLVTVAAWEGDAWRVVDELDLPCREGSGVHEIDLHGLEARFLKLTCTRHHPGEPKGYQQWASPYNVPYQAVSGMTFAGEYLTDPYAAEADQLPLGDRLQRGEFAPQAPAGMAVKTGGNQVRFFSERFSVGFSLQRPLITHMGWDALRQKAADNLIHHRYRLLHFTYPAQQTTISGPHWRTLPWTAWSSVWGGRISVEGNRVVYTGLHVGDEVVIDAAFTVQADGMRLEIRQRTRTQRPTLELEAWRFLWNSHASAVASMAQPILRGRTGAAELPVIWSAPGYGCLSCAVLESTGPVRLQADSHRDMHMTFAGLVLGADEPYPADHFIPGERDVSAVLEFRPEPVLPVTAPGVERNDLHGAIIREWGPAFMFRPELAGFSNNALSTNCHLAQTGVTDMAAFTRKPERGPHPIELARHTITMALRGGRGYGDNREIYLDSDPSLLNAAGRIQMTAPDMPWLREIWPWLRRTTLRHLATCAENGLAVAQLPTGNRNQTPFYMCNGCDVVGCGHFDGMSNSETYRAWKNVLALAKQVGDDDLRDRLRDTIARLREHYSKVLFNPETGWLGSWRSRDGELHDYGMSMQNAGAILYGLVEESVGRDILRRMEARREEMGVSDASYGFPAYLLPIPMSEHNPFAGGTAYRQDGADAFGIFCNGTLTHGFGYLYLRALSQYGPAGHADRATREILDAHLELDVIGGEDSGVEFHSFDGAAAGYEGAYIFQFSVLLAAAQHMGWAPITTPEFWPAEAEE